MTPSEPQVTSSSGAKWMLLLAWASAMLLLVVVFDDLLDKQINPNAEPESRFQNGKTEVILNQNRYGHYVVDGLINGKSVTFMLDTGATQVSIPRHLAKKLGLKLGAKYWVSTANGNIEVTHTRIDSLSVGGIRLEDVTANINPGMQDDEILLGMSALRQLDFIQQGNTLLLRQSNSKN